MELFHTEDLIVLGKTDSGDNVYWNSNLEYFALIPDVTSETLKAAIAEIRSTDWYSTYLLTQDGTYNKWGKMLYPVLEEVTDIESLRCALNKCAVLAKDLHEKPPGKHRGISFQTSFRRSLGVLYKHGVILFPFGIAINRKNVINEVANDVNFLNVCDYSLNLLEEYKDILPNNSSLSIAFKKLVSTCSPTLRVKHVNKELLDAIGAICLEVIHDTNTDRALFNLLKLSLRIFGFEQTKLVNDGVLDEEYFKEDEFNNAFNPGKMFANRRNDLNRQSKTFNWAASKYPELATLCGYLTKYVDNREKTIDELMAINHCNYILDFFISRPRYPRDPRMFLQEAQPPSATEFTEFLNYDVGGKTAKRKCTVCGGIIDFIFEEIGAVLVEEETGEKILLDGYAPLIDPDLIPVDYADSGLGQSAKFPLPTKFVELLEIILTEDDFAFSKSLSQEYFNWFNPETKKHERVFSPVRTYALLTLLRLPMRYVQVRMLDSGEGDLLRYDPDSGWGENDHQCMGTCKKEGQGILRKEIDYDTGEEKVSFYINTNKTGDIGKDKNSRGYIMPGFDEVAIQIFSDLRTWQEKYNPAEAALPFSETREWAKASDNTKRRSPDRFYLFRNPLGTNRLAPLFHDDLDAIWRAALKELERRLADMGITNQDKAKSPIVLVHGKNPIYTLHSLRVTGLTSLAKNGVPIDVLSKMIGGHATVLMTLHYLKYSQGYVEEVLQAAAYQASGQAEAELKLYLRDYQLTGDPKDNRRYACNSEEALMQAKTIQTGLWKIMDHGICPNGGTMCNDGWRFEDEFDGKIRTRILPVPEAGSTGCGLCRFFLTGPPWGAGLTAKSNEAILFVNEVSEDRRKVKREKQILEKQHSEEGPAFTKFRELKSAQERYDTESKRLDIYMDIQQSLVNLNLQSTQLGKEWAKDGGSGKLPIIFQCDPSELEAQFVECTNFDLYDDICQSSEFFPSVNPKVASLRRSKLLNKALDNSGKRPIFLYMDEEEQLVVANAVAKFLMLRFGRKKTNELIDGHTTLQQIGLKDQELESAMLEALDQSQLTSLERDDDGGLSLTVQDKISLSPLISNGVDENLLTGGTTIQIASNS